MKVKTSNKMVWIIAGAIAFIIALTSSFLLVNSAKQKQEFASRTASFYVQLEQACQDEDYTKICELKIQSEIDDLAFMKEQEKWEEIQNEFEKAGVNLTKKLNAEISEVKKLIEAKEHDNAIIKADALISTDNSKILQLKTIAEDSNIEEIISEAKTLKESAIKQAEEEKKKAEEQKRIEQNKKTSSASNIKTQNTTNNGISETKQNSSTQISEASSSTTTPKKKTHREHTYWAEENAVIISTNPTSTIVRYKPKCPVCGKTDGSTRTTSIEGSKLNTNGVCKSSSKCSNFGKSFKVVIGHSSHSVED